MAEVISSLTATLENDVEDEDFVKPEENQKKTAVVQSRMKTFNPYLTKPARRQVKKGSQPRTEFTHHSSEYNIWYGKKLGDRFSKEDRIKAATRCCVSTDAGYTRPDLNGKDSYICLYFARGHCINGAECNFYHRIPTLEDDQKLDLAHDIFGRERHRTYREDMGGVGSFTRDNRTLYVSNIKRGGNMDEIVKRHFAEWGEMEYVRVIWDKSIAFVKYALRSSAEFAKEAMTDQSLDGDEVLSIRWSNEDPNPSSKEKEEEASFNQLAEAVAKKQKEIEPLYQYETPEGGVSSDNFPSEYNPHQYPNTEAQFTETYSNSSKVIEEWLNSLGLVEYKDSFLSAGYFDLQSLSQLDDYSLDAIGVTSTEDRARLMEATSKLQEKVIDVPVTANIYQQNQYDQYGAYSYWYTNEEYQGYQPIEPTVEEPQQKDPQKRSLTPLTKQTEKKSQDRKNRKEVSRL